MGTIRDELAKRLGISSEAFGDLIARREAERGPARRAAEDAAGAEHVARAPRYPQARPMPLPEARELLAKVPPRPENPSVSGIFDPETFGLPSVQYVEGDLELPSLVLAAEGSNLIVRGDLVVHGVLEQAFRAGGLLVLGNLRARHLVTTGQIACVGDLSVEGVLYGNCTNYATSVWGKARADVVVSAKEHLFSFWGGLEAALVVDVTGGAENLGGGQFSGETMHEVLDAAIGDGYDAALVLALLAQRGTIRRART